MAVTLVQTSSQARGSGTTLGVSFSSLPAAGNAVICVIAMNNDGGLGSLADNQSGNTYTTVISQRDAGGGTNSAAACCSWCPSITSPSGTFTVTITPTNGAGGGTIAAVLYEVSGLSGSVDQTGGDNGGSQTATSVSPTCSAANTVANDFAVFAFASKFNASNQSFYTAGPGGSWNNTFLDTGNGQGIVAAVGQKILSAVETTSATSQTLTAGVDIAGMVATFKGPQNFQPYPPMYRILPYITS